MIMQFTDGLLNVITAYSSCDLCAFHVALFEWVSVKVVRDAVKIIATVINHRPGVKRWHLTASHLLSSVVKYTQEKALSLKVNCTQGDNYPYVSVYY